jgi:N-acetylglutamate synthase-like GNAT family acetyltransferase
MTEWSTDLTTRDGFNFHVRPVRADDEMRLSEFFRHVTPEDLRFRFLGTIKAMDHDRLAEMIDVDHRQKESFVACELRSGRIIAAAMLACDADLESAEVAVSIRSDFKNRGVSWALLAHISRFAQAKGVKRLQSLEDRANVSAITLEKEMGFTSQPYDGDSRLTLLEKALA